MIEVLFTLAVALLLCALILWIVWLILARFITDPTLRNIILALVGLVLLWSVWRYLSGTNLL